MIANIESGRREYVSLDDLYVFALAFDVAPAHLMVPWENEEPVTVAGDRTEPAGLVRAWVRGARPLDGVKTTTYAEASPAGHYRRSTDHGQRLATATRAQTLAFQRSMAAHAAFETAEVELARANLTGDEEQMEAAQADYRQARIERAKAAGRARLYGQRVDDIEAEAEAADRGYVEEPFDPFALDDSDDEGTI